MYLLRTEAAFDSAHFLKGYEGKCANLHGHRWRMVVEVGGEQLQEEGEKQGMLVDFADLKGAVRELADSLDHRLLMEDSSLKPETISALVGEGFSLLSLPFRPTAENLARYLYKELQSRGFPLRSVTVYETPENCAVYQEGAG